MAAAFAEIGRARPLSLKTSREITVAVMGAGSRGQTYTEYGKLFPGTLKVVAVSDIQKERCDSMGRLWKIPQERRFGDFREMLAAGRNGNGCGRHGKTNAQGKAAPMRSRGT